MNTLNRRQFLKLAGAIAALAAVPRAVGAATTAPRVVVVGGGFGGATLAKYVRMWGGNVAGHPGRRQPQPRFLHPLQPGGHRRAADEPDHPGFRFAEDQPRRHRDARPRGSHRSARATR